MNALRKPTKLEEVAADAAALGLMLAPADYLGATAQRVLVDLAPCREPRTVRDLSDRVAGGRSNIRSALLSLELRGLVRSEGLVRVPARRPAQCWRCTTAGRTIADRIARGDL